MLEEVYFTLAAGAVLVYLVHIWTRPLHPSPSPAAAAPAPAPAVSPIPHSAPAPTPTPAASAAFPIPASPASALGVACTVKLLCGSEHQVITLVIATDALSQLTVAHIKRMAFAALTARGVKVVSAGVERRSGSE